MFDTFSFVILILAVYLSTLNGAPQCEKSWMAYKDELCLKIFTNLETYKNAQAFCESQGDEFLHSSLVLVKDDHLQSILTNFTNGIFDYIWLGGRYDHGLSKFKWEDGQNLVYTNWLDGYPRNLSESDACIEMRSPESHKSSNDTGKWTHATCRKRNLVMCQKRAAWSKQDAVTEIIKLRKQLVKEQERLDCMKNELEEERRQIQEVKQQLLQTGASVVPVGSIYIEYYNQPSPKSLWSSFTWQDITKAYAGLFFRAFGGGSESWGKSQDECAPRVSQMQYLGRIKKGYASAVNIPRKGWSEPGTTGEHEWPITNRNYESVRFYSADCEIRPKNQAIRIWKRIK